MLKLAIANVKKDVPEVQRGDMRATILVEKDLGGVVFPGKGAEVHVTGTCDYLSVILDEATFSEFIQNSHIEVQS